MGQVFVEIEEPVHSLAKPQWLVWTNEQFAWELIEGLLLLQFFVVEVLLNVFED